MRASTVTKHKTMSGAVHRLQSILLFVDREGEHIIFIVLPVTRLFPQGSIEHVRGHDLKGKGRFKKKKKKMVHIFLLKIDSNYLRIASVPVLRLQQIHQLIVNTSPMGQKEGTTSAPLMEHEQFLFSTNFAVISVKGGRGVRKKHHKNSATIREHHPHGQQQPQTSTQLGARILRGH